MRVAIAVPHTGTVHAKFAFSLAQMVTYATVSGIEVAMVDAQTSLVPKGRHELVQQAMGAEADAIIFFDSDMVFPMETVAGLVNADKDIIGLNYRRTVPPHDETARNIHKDGSCDWIGTGGLFINLCVFRDIGVPYFKIDYDKEKDTFQSEDYNFALRARLVGYKIWVHKELSKGVVHIGQEGYVL